MRRWPRTGLSEALVIPAWGSARAEPTASDKPLSTGIVRYEFASFTGLGLPVSSPYQRCADGCEGLAPIRSIHFMALARSLDIVA